MVFRSSSHYKLKEHEKQTNKKQINVVNVGLPLAKLSGSVHVCSHYAEEERTGCFTLFVFLLSSSCCCFVFLPRGAVGWYLIMAFPGHTHLLLDYKILEQK